MSPLIEDLYNTTLYNLIMPHFALPKYADKPASRALVRYGELAVTYLLLIFLLPGNQQVMQAHSLTSTEYHILQLLVGLPLLAVWFMGFYGYAKLQEYAESIRKTPEAAGFKRLAEGCAWIAWSLPIHSIIALLGRAITDAHPGSASAVIIISNYIDLLFPVVAFSLIGMASRHLFDKAKVTLSGASIRGITLLFLVAGVLYCYLIFRQFSDSSLAATGNPYHLPVWVLVLTVIVPYLYAWFVGLLAIYELITYGRHVRGVLYRQAVHLLVLGLLAMVLGSIASQYSRSAEPTSGHLLLDAHLVFSLIFQIISGLGFVMIALGATRLKKIEEV